MLFGSTFSQSFIISAISTWNFWKRAFSIYISLSHWKSQINVSLPIFIYIYIRTRPQFLWWIFSSLMLWTVLQAVSLMEQSNPLWTTMSVLVLPWDLSPPWHKYELNFVVNRNVLPPHASTGWLREVLYPY